MPSENPQISVVIPVYNGGQFIARTLDALRQQTFADFEVLCVNDCSTDDSGAVLQQYAQNDPRIRVFTTPTNQGIPSKVIKPYALPNLRGEYYVYSSQDDLFSPDWLEKMWHKARETGADAVLPKLVFAHAHNPAKNHSLVGINGNLDVVLTNREAVILSLDWLISGNALWKVSLVKRLDYPDFGLYADEYFVRELFFHANKVVFCEGTFYYSQDNPASIARKPGYKRFDSPYNHYKLFEFLKQHDFAPDICAQELMRAIRDLLQKKQELILNQTRYSSEHRQEAENRIQKCYATISQNEAAVSLLKQKTRFKHAPKVFAMTHGYRFFSAYCQWLAQLRRIRRWISCRSGKPRGTPA